MFLVGDLCNVVLAVSVTYEFLISGDPVLYFYAILLCVIVEQIN